MRAMGRVGELIPIIERFYEEADARTAKFSQASGLKCPTGCGRCCESPYIEASALECLPMANHLLPKAGEWIEILESFVKRGRTLPSPCPFYVTFGFGKGFCSEYEHRPSVCRLFGFAAVRGKQGEPRLSVCHHHKENGTAIPPVDPDATGESVAPCFTDFTLPISTLDPSLSKPQAIVQALLLALQVLRREKDMENGTHESDQTQSAPAW